MTKPKSALAAMAEPVEKDCAHALVVLTYQAREALSFAEREADINKLPSPSAGIQHLETAHKHLNGALAMTEELPRTLVARALLNRAVRSTEATLGQVRLYGLYAAIKSPSELEIKQVGSLRNIWRRAACSAKQEAHRALHELTRCFPDAYDVES